MHAAVAPTPRTVDLEPGQLLNLESPVACIRVAQGQVWITGSDDPHDVFLDAGDSWGSAGRPLLIGALAPTRLQLSGPAGGPRRTAASAWRRAAQVLQRRIRQLQFGPAEVPSWR